VYTKGKETARTRLDAQSKKRVADAKKEQGLKLTPSKLTDWEIQVEVERMLDEMQDTLADVRKLLKGKDRDKVKKALERLGKVEQ